jgi:hypothetical protein
MAGQDLAVRLLGQVGQVEIRITFPEGFQHHRAHDHITQVTQACDQDRAQGDAVQGPGQSQLRFRPRCRIRAKAAGRSSATNTRQSPPQRLRTFSSCRAP